MSKRRRVQMKSKALKVINIFDVNDLPNMGAGVRGFTYGFTIYCGVLVQWDEDKDERVLIFINELNTRVRRQLAIVQEHEGSLGLVWHTIVPSGYEMGEEFEVEGDFWVVQTSNTAKRLRCNRL
jgi:hypothetical protein